MLNIRQLSKTYRVKGMNFFQALNNINVDIEYENLVAIIGESGSGKSTLMNLISTMDKPTYGQVFFNGKIVTFQNEKTNTKYRKENVGFIFQSFNLIKDLTVLDNVAIVMEIAGVSKKERVKRAKELLTLVGLEDHLNKTPGLLSGGQKQRVAIARALANDPDLILADEPTGALDSETTIEIMSLLSTIAKSGKKVLIVTHDHEVASYCERIITLHDGFIVSDVYGYANTLPPTNLPDPVKTTKKGLRLSGIFKLSHNAFKRKLKRNLIVAIGTAIAVSSLLIVNMTNSTLDNYFDNIYGQYGNENIIVIEYYSDQIIEDNSIAEDNVLDIVDYYTYAEDVKSYTMLEEYDIEYAAGTINDTLEISFVPMFPEPYETFGEKDIVTGTAPKEPNEIAVSETTISELGISVQDAVGTEVKLDVNEVYGVECYGFDDSDCDIEAIPTETETMVISAVLSDNSPQFFANSVYITTEFAEKYDYETINYYTYTFIFEAKDGEVEKVYDAFNKNSYNYSLSTNNYDYAIAYRHLYVISGIEEGLLIFYITLNLILGISVIVAIIMISIMCYVSILERIKEIGVLRAVGARKRDIRRMFYYEAIGIGLLSGIIAILMSVIIGMIAVNYANKKFNIGEFVDIDLTFSIDWYVIPITIFLTILLALFSSLISIFRGLKISPIEALKTK